MHITINELISEIGYSQINVFMEAPIFYDSFELDIDHISLYDSICHIEGTDGNFFEIPAKADIEIEDGEYHIRQDGCHICIKLSV